MQTGVVIFEDNDNLRESLGNLITYSGNLVLLGAFPNAQEVRQRVSELQPEVILMDIDMPGVSGIEAVKIIRGFNRQVQIIMLTVFDDSRHVYEAICNGASGYLLKKYISDKLFESIEEVLSGGAPMSPGIARLIIESMQHNHQPEADTYNLTKREKEILANLSKGNSYKLIAADLSISIDTVRTHIKHIYEKLEVHNQAEAVSKAINERLV